MRLNMDSLQGIDEVVHEPDPEFAAETNVQQYMDSRGIDNYEQLIERTCHGIDGEPASGVEWFWDDLVDWLGVEFDEPYDRVRDDTDGPQFSDWYPGGKLNIAHNTLDRHAAAGNPTRDKAACVWEGEGGSVKEVSFGQLHEEANQVANFLASESIGVGDTVALYMPMVPEIISILYGCFKTGAIAVPIFSGFGTEATATRLEDASASVLFTADGFYRRGSEVQLKGPADDAIAQAGTVETTVVYDRFGAVPGSDRDTDATTAEIPWDEERDIRWGEAVGTASSEFDSRSLPSNAESMLLYSSGTTGEPKGIVHTHAGAVMQGAKEIHFGFDQKDEDNFFWLSDIGWMMGPWTLIGNHTFGGTIFMYEGAPDHPEPDRLWDMIDRHNVTVFGISPTAIRALRKHGDDWVEGHDFSSLRLLGSTGEPWDPESWRWFYETVGGGNTPIINISGGTEIMGCFLMPMPNQPLKPCTLGGPGLGMDIDIVDRDGVSIEDDSRRGFLVANDSCPSMTKSLWSGDDRYLEEYWGEFDDKWNHGDWAQKDQDGFWFLHGRADDALNVAGRKVGPAEIEGVLVDHSAVNQAAAVGVPDDTTGTAVVCYVITEPGTEQSADLRTELGQLVGDEHGKPFKPREIVFIPDLPRTQSGKIIRRAISATHQGEDLGDMSSIENPEAIEAIRNAT